MPRGRRRLEAARHRHRQRRTFWSRAHGAQRDDQTLRIARILPEARS